MTEPNSDTGVQSHMRWLALSRWENEGGAGLSRPTAGSVGPALRHQIRPRVSTAQTKGAVLLVLAHETAAPPARWAPD